MAMARKFPVFFFGWVETKAHDITVKLIEIQGKTCNPNVVSGTGETEDQLSEGDTDQLTDACRRFFDRRQKTLKARWTQQPTATLQHQMAHLRREIVSVSDGTMGNVLIWLALVIFSIKCYYLLRQYYTLHFVRMNRRVYQSIPQYKSESHQFIWMVKKARGPYDVMFSFFYPHWHDERLSC